MGEVKSGSVTGVSVLTSSVFSCRSTCCQHRASPSENAAKPFSLFSLRLFFLRSSHFLLFESTFSCKRVRYLNRHLNRHRKKKPVLVSLPLKLNERGRKQAAKARKHGEGKPQGLYAESMCGRN